MAENQDNQNLYSRWLAGDLSEEELQNLKATEDFKLLESIAKETSTWTVQGDIPSFEVFKSATLQKPQKKAKVIALHQKKWTLGLAASVGLLLVIGFTIKMMMGNSPIQYACGPGEKQHIVLPDGSTVELNANSSLSYFNNHFEEEPVIELTGNAFFKGPHATNFTVNTKDSKIKVVGTSFQVNEYRLGLALEVYEGAVEITSNNSTQKVSAGSGIRLVKGTFGKLFHNDQKAPAWLEGKSLFNNAPFDEVITEIERQFNVKIQGVDRHLDRKFTGQFSHQNLNQALEIVFKPLGIGYEINGSTVSLD